MASSDFQGFIRHDQAIIADGYPVNAALYRDVLDSQLHLFDEYAQVRVAFPERSGSLYMTTATPANTSTYYPVGPAFGPFPLTINAATGASFAVRILATVAMSGAKTGTFHIVVSAPSRAAAYAAGTPGSNVLVATTASTGVVDLAPSSNIVTLDTTMVNEALIDRAAYDAVSSGTPVSVPVCWVTCSVWAKTADVTALPRLFGLYVAEYVGT